MFKFAWSFGLHHYPRVAWSVWSSSLRSLSNFANCSLTFCMYAIRSMVDSIRCPTILGYYMYIYMLITTCIYIYICLLQPSRMATIICLSAPVNSVKGEYSSVWLPSVHLFLSVLLVWLTIFSILYNWSQYLTLAISLLLLFLFIELFFRLLFYFFTVVSNWYHNLFPFSIWLDPFIKIHPSFWPQIIFFLDLIFDLQIRIFQWKCRH